MTAISPPHQCLHCGGYLTMNNENPGHRCTDPAHWLAAGVLAQDDFYSMAQVIASTRTPPPSQLPLGGSLDTCQTGLRKLLLSFITNLHML
jgi:hypothetical protein